MGSKSHHTYHPTFMPISIVVLYVYFTKPVPIKLTNKRAGNWMSICFTVGYKCVTVWVMLYFNSTI